MDDNVILGIDNGYGFTKVSDGQIFMSSITDSNPFAVDQDINSILVDNKLYYVGLPNGSIVMDINKSDNTITKICTLYALANAKGSNFNIVAGLPINQYNGDQSKILKESILSLNDSVVKTKNTEKTIKINNVFIYAQGIASIFSGNITENTIIIDVGYRTVDIAYIKNDGANSTVEQHNTYYCGCGQLYSKIASETNRLYGLTLPDDEGYTILTAGLTVDGAKIKTDYVAEICRQHYSDLFTAINRDYPARTVGITLTGGGASILYNAIKSRYSNVNVVKNNQMSNAIGYKMIGEKLWKK